MNRGVAQMLWLQSVADGYLCLTSSGKGGLCLDVGIGSAAGLPPDIRSRHLVRDRFVVEFRLTTQATQEIVGAGAIPRGDASRGGSGLPSSSAADVLSSSAAGDPEYLLSALADPAQQVVFLTGAGISCAAGIWGDAALSEQLRTHDPPSLCWYSVVKPEVIIGRFKIFVAQLRMARPTPAHQALASIVRRYSRALVTQNVDCLHERSGVKPLRLLSTEARATLRNLAPDVVVALGVSQLLDVSLVEHWRNRGAAVHLVNQGMSTTPHLIDFSYDCDLQLALPDWQGRLCSR